MSCTRRNRLRNGAIPLISGPILSKAGALIALCGSDIAYPLGWRWSPHQFEGSLNSSKTVRWKRSQIPLVCGLLVFARLWSMFSTAELWPEVGDGVTG